MACKTVTKSMSGSTFTNKRIAALLATLIPTGKFSQNTLCPIIPPCQVHSKMAWIFHISAGEFCEKNLEKLSN
jgi:hypothetical protein